MGNELDDRTYELLFGINRSARYHSHRRRFYESWNTATVALAVLGGSSAAMAFFSTPAPSWLGAAFAGVVALAGALDLAVGTSRCANLHGDLTRRFIALEQRFAHGRSLDDEEFEQLTRMRLEIESGEPPVLRLLDVICHYELLRALGDQRRPPRIPLWRRVLAPWLHYTQHLAPAQPG